MNEHLDDEVLIRRAMEELPMSSEMPQKLKWKLMDLATETNRRPRSARRPWMVAGLTAGFAALALAAYFLSPKQAMAKSWTLVKQAVEQVRTFQMLVHTDKEKDVRIATTNGKMLVDSGEGEIVYIDNSAIQVYEAKENKVTRINIPGMGAIGTALPDIMGAVASQFDLKKDLAKFEEQYGKENIQISSIYEKDGRKVYDVRMHDPKGQGEAFLTVDANSDLPIYIRANDLADKDGNVEISLRYNDQIEIEPHFPKGVKYEDIDISNMKNLGIDPDKLSKEISDGISNGLKGMGGK